MKTSSRFFAAALSGALLFTLAACSQTAPTAPDTNNGTADAKMPTQCEKIADSKEKQDCVAAFNVATDQCEKEEIAYNKAKKDDKKKFNMTSCVNKKVNAAMDKKAEAEKDKK